MTAAAHHDEIAKLALAKFIKRSHRNTSLQLPPSFARGSKDVRGAPPLESPLGKLVRGGRGGEVRLKVYLSIALLAGSAHHHRLYGPNAIFDVSSPAWARILCLPDPDKAGARRVAYAQTWLHNSRLLVVERRPGAEPLVRLLSADGAGGAWSRPTAPYIHIPLELWSNHWIWTLSATELAVFIALLDLQGGRGTQENPKPQWMTKETQARYGMSTDTWRIASASLERMGLVSTRIGPQQKNFETTRDRKSYWAITTRLSDEALEI